MPHSVQCPQPTRSKMVLESDTESALIRILTLGHRIDAVYHMNVRNVIITLRKFVHTTSLI